MDPKGTVNKVHNNGEKAHQTCTNCLHAFSDLAPMNPLVFIFLLKCCYDRGTQKGKVKFHALQEQVLQTLQNAPKAGPITFIFQCLLILPILGEPHTNGFSKLLLTALQRLRTIKNFPIIPEDLSKARSLTAHLLINCIMESNKHKEKILMQLLVVVDVRLKHIGEVLCRFDVRNDIKLVLAKGLIEEYIKLKKESGSYMLAVTLLEHFSFRMFDESFLVNMMEKKDFKIAEKWATFMGAPMLCSLVKQYIGMKMLNNAYETIEHNNLQEKCQDEYLQCKKSLIKKLVEKGCWDIAEEQSCNKKQLVEYLVFLAMEAGYSKKADELCERYSLTCFKKFTEAKAIDSSTTCYLYPNEFILRDVKWVDEIEGLLSATCHMIGCKFVAIDCEWKATYEKGSNPNKVSIMQIASEEEVFIFDLIKLTKEEPEALKDCLQCIFRSPSILKLGYNLNCDLQQLFHSYGELGCFKRYEMLLDIQNVFKGTRGGLSRLCEEILGAGLDKMNQMSDWEERPLSQNHLGYAALDAIVLIHIFRHVYRQGVNNKVEWTSHIVTHYNASEKQRKRESK